MADTFITCPKCGQQFALTEVMTNQIAQQVRSELAEEMQRKEQELHKKEEDITQQKRELAEKVQGVEAEIQEKVRQKEDLLIEDARRRATEEVATRLLDLQNQITEKDGKLQESREAELGFLRRTRQVEEKEKELDITVEKRISEQMAAIEKSAEQRIEERHQLSVAETNRKLQDTQTQLEELRRRLAQGSQQAQGEILETEFEGLLVAKFPLDRIEPVPKGVSGADILHHVTDGVGNHCGTIVWELKNTKTWSDSWILKLKDDMPQVSGDVGVIVTTSLPKDAAKITERDGIWICEPQLAGDLAAILRATLIEINRVRVASSGKNEKVEALYRYLTGPEFRLRVEAIIDAFVSMRNDLEGEKRAVHRLWMKREKQIDRARDGAVAMYGALEGIIGASMPQLPALEFEEAEDADTKAARLESTGSDERENQQGNDDLPF